MTKIYKICDESFWRAAESFGVFSGSADDLRDGFIHFSTAAQARETAAKHFAGRSGLLLIAFEAEALGPELRWEPSRGGALFPHLHRALNPEEALWSEPLPLGPDGAHVFPPGMI